MIQKRSRIVVRGCDIRQPPLLDSEEAYSIEFIDPDGNIMALCLKVFTDDLWAVMTKNDADWNESLVRYGYKKVDRNIESVIKNGL